jgi:hypothetical protein
METYLLFEFYEYYPAGGMDDFKSQHKTLDDALATPDGGWGVHQQIVRASLTTDSGLAFTNIASRYGSAEWDITEQAAAYTTGVPQPSGE